MAKGLLSTLAEGTFGRTLDVSLKLVKVKPGRERKEKPFKMPKAKRGTW